jgi:hypothetical protein
MTLNSIRRILELEAEVAELRRQLAGERPAHPHTPSGPA